MAPNDLDGPDGVSGSSFDRDSDRDSGRDSDRDSSSGVASDGSGGGGSGSGSGTGQQDGPYLMSGTNPFSSVYPRGTGMFPKLAPRAFPPDDEDGPPELDELPVMEQLPDSPTYGPPPAYGPQAGGFGADAYYGTSRVPGAAPPLPGRAGHAAPGSSESPSGTRSGSPSMPPAAWFAAGPLSARFAAGPLGARFAADQADDRFGAGPADDRFGAGPADDRFGAGPAGAGPVGPSQSKARPAWVHPSAGPVPGSPAGQPLSAPPMDPDPVFDPPIVTETSDVLTADWLLHGRRAQPGPGGWRRTVFRATGGLVKFGESTANIQQRNLTHRVRTPVAGGHHRVAVMSLKGGVGKTTTAVGLGATLASLRGDRVIAMDANPDRGTLSDKVRLETAATVRDLLNYRAGIRRYADVRQFTSQASSRLEILASDRDPGVSLAFDADDYREVSRVLEYYYSIAITDCGTGLLHSAMSGILELADHIVLVSSPSVDGARSASATLDWLEAHQYTDLVRSAVVVLSTIRPKSKSTVDLDRLEAHFASRCRDVVRVPYDAHLEEGAEVELDLLSAATQDAFLTLAATVADGFAVPRRARMKSGSALS